jgi:chaperonin cofactor prefoldin
MLTLAKRKHQEAMAVLGTPNPSAVPRLREVLRLLEELELLADDASVYV